MADDDVARIRAFNRFYTRQIGLLNEVIARSRFSLGEGRVLYEIAQRGHTTGAELAASLGLDPAYLSRILQKFLGQGLVLLSPSPTDRRANRITLSEAGDVAMAELETLNDAAIEAVLAPVAPADRPALVAAMSTIRSILGDTPRRGPIILRPHRVGEYGWLIHRQGLLYNQQFGWDIGFEALAAGIYREFHDLPATPPKALWVAEHDGGIVGSVFVIPLAGSTGTAQLRMLYVEPETRGQGLGTTLVRQAVAFARDSGYRRMRLWTQANLEAARRIYAAAGFTMVEASPHHSFGKDLVSEFWELEL
ncbi:MAG: MarR family transcriptional regulator [Devosia nanyangense]|uniref:MarR family transcriptional regulator n=1 Tax=Devosia nanyangense TaxID=1228055 RepID=A0A933L0C9_9HYPH|nr:MarR family transcriptional regulator [Devosia nanyangense]